MPKPAPYGVPADLDPVARTKLLGLYRERYGALDRLEAERPPAARRPGYRPRSVIADYTDAEGDLHLFALGMELQNYYRYRDTA